MLFLDSINKKETTQEKRGKGIRRKVLPETKLPVNFNVFMQESNNKEEIFALLTDVVPLIIPRGREIYISSGKLVVSKSSIEPMPASDHEEADIRICLHVIDIVERCKNY